MRVLRIAAALTLAASSLAAEPASAQFFLKSHSMAGEAVTGDQSALGLPMPGATAAELRAGTLWNMRAALNVAALQCQFEPTLLVVSNYNSILIDHKDEIKSAFDTLSKYYLRNAKTKVAGQAALDLFSTRTYSGFATVSAQYGFCQTANAVGRDAIFTPRGALGALAEGRMRELRNSLIPYGEQRFPRVLSYDMAGPPLPRFDAICWNKKAEWQDRKCGAQNWPPPAEVGVATR